MITVYHNTNNPGSPLTVDQANMELASRQYARVAEVTGNSLLVVRQRSDYAGWISKMCVRQTYRPAGSLHLVRPTAPGDILERDGEMFLVMKAGFVSLMSAKQALYG